ncbi:MAG: hypothetical protein KIT58_23460 [Planctomycetota bacterium]|nr:hypothetical protein [Planctomycetota bacterium]
MEKKHALAGLAVVAVIGVVALPWARWGLFVLQAHGTVEKLGRFPDAGQILALPEGLRQDARKYGIDPSKLQVRLGLEERAVMAGIAFTFVTVEASDGKRTFSYSAGSERGRRIETAHTAEFLEALREGGVDFSRFR